MLWNMVTKVAPNAMEPVWYFQKAKLANEVKINQTKNLKLSFKKRARFYFFFFTSEISCILQQF